MSSQNPADFTIPVKDFKRIETPLDYKGYRNYITIVDVLDIPESLRRNASNVRDAKSKGKVPNAIREGLLENELFVFMNRGILLIADGIEFDNKTSKMKMIFKENNMVLVMEDTQD